MDATSSGSGFDAALKALEDLETSVAPAIEDKPSAPAAAPQPVSIGFDDAEPEPESQLEGEPVAISAQPIDEMPLAELEALATAAIETPYEAGAHSAAPEPAPAPPHAAAAAPAAGKFGKIAVGLALFSSLLSAVGLVVAERTIMSAQLVVADARERAEQFEKANKVIRDLELVRAKQIELLQAQQAQLASAPVSSAELQRKMDALQTGLMARDPMNEVVAAIRAGQSDTAGRFSEFGMKIERLEAALGH